MITDKLYYKIVDWAFTFVHKSDGTEPFLGEYDSHLASFILTSVYVDIALLLVYLNDHCINQPEQSSRALVLVS